MRIQKTSQYEMIKCPVCGEKLLGVKIHITQQAKKELWNKHFFGGITPHLDFFENNIEKNDDIFKFELKKIIK